MHLLIVPADQSIAELALPPLVDVEIPWHDLDATRKSYIPSVCNLNGMSTINPNKMSVAEAYHLYEHIISLQDTPTPFAFTPIYQVPEEEIVSEIGALSHIFKFILADSNIYSLLDDHASEEALDEDNPKGATGEINSNSGMLRLIFSFLRQILIHLDASEEALDEDNPKGATGEINLNSGMLRLIFSFLRQILIHLPILGDDDASTGNPKGSSAVTSTKGQKKKGKKRPANDKEVAETAPVKKQRRLPCVNLLL